MSDLGQPPADATTGELDQGHPRKWWILTAVSLGMFMTLLDITIVNIAVPAVMKDLGASVARVSWVINAYSLALAVLFLSMGGFADRLGRKTVFLCGLGVFTVFSLACGIAPNIAWLIVFRVGQGIGGATMAPLSLAILLGVFPRRQHGVAVGLWGALGTVAAAIGPSLGGILIEAASWHWVFLINVPIGVIALALCWWTIPKVKTAPSGAGIDLPAVLVSAVGLFCLVLALIQANEWGWGSARILGLFAVAVVSFPLFAWRELRTRAPMFDFRLLRIRSFTAANTAMFFIGATMGGVMLLLVIFLVSVLGYSELRAALAITPMPLVALIAAPNIGRLTDRIGPRLPAAMGAGFFGVGVLLLAMLNGSSSAWDVTWRLLFVGAGMGFIFPSLSSAAMSSLPPRVAGVGSGALNTLRQVGFSLGVAVLVAIFTHGMTTNMAIAVEQSKTFVNSQSALPAAARAEIGAAIDKAAAAAAKGDTAQAAGLFAAAPAGSPQAKMQATIAQIFKDNKAKSFRWPYLTAALLAFLAVIPALLTGRRLGEHAGHDEMTREQRAAAGAAAVKT